MICSDDIFRGLLPEILKYVKLLNLACHLSASVVSSL